MQYVIIALVVAVALAAVIVPLVHGPRSPAHGDLDPLPRSDADHPGAGTPLGEPRTAGFPPERPVQPPPPEPRTTPEPTVSPEGPQPPGEADVEELPVSAPPPPGPVQPLGASAAGRVGVATASPSVTLRPRESGARAAGATSPEEEAVLRYREALRAGTVCPACMQANPPGSAYCMECGERLGGAK